MSTTTEAAAAVVDALGAAWSVHALYPDPLEQPAFIRAVDAIREVGGDTFVVLVSPGGFVHDGEALDDTRGSAGRLAKRLYVHNVDSLEVTGRPSERDVVRLFDLIGREEDDVAAGGGIGAALARDGVTSFAVSDRAPLAESAELANAGVERNEEVERVLAGGADPETFATDLTAAGGGDPETVAQLVYEKYVEVMHLIDPADIVGGEAAVQAFVEAFFHLDDAIQQAVLERFLQDHTSPMVRPFLDQFASHELVKFAPQLDPHAFSLLMGYAEIVTDPEADERSQDLLSLLKAPQQLETARAAIADQIESRFGSFDDSTQVITVDVPDPRHYFFTVLDGFRDLLDVEDRPERFRRVLRIWSGKMKSAIRRGEIRRAELWVRAITDHPTYGPEWQDDVDRAVESTITDELLRQLLALNNDQEREDEIERFVVVAGKAAVRPLITILAEGDSTSRRPVMDLLTTLAARHPQPVIGSAAQAPWYLARNLAVILRRAHVTGAAQLMADLVVHDDARVRVEAVRGLAVLGGAETLPLIADSMADEDDAVRSTALTALGTSHHEGAEEILVESISSSKLTAAQRARAIELLARQPTEDTRALLERLAGRRIALTATARQIRAAARDAIEGGNA
ncbi:MAG: hypothetical protein OEM97_07510 [Acidimicrobiia bacterium]|nr:hypothetical protein [Acidimicrobiia bacterium]